MSHICLMGNTFFSKKGGHNLVEPAVNANSIILGPDYATCKDLADMICRTLKTTVRRHFFVKRNATYPSKLSLLICALKRSSRVFIA